MKLLPIHRMVMKTKRENSAVCIKENGNHRF